MLDLIPGGTGLGRGLGFASHAAHESKAGVNVKPTTSIRRQIAKDKELIDTGQVDGAHWHFWQGADQSLLDELVQAGIDFTVH